MKPQKPDYWIIFFTFLLLGFGLVMVFSTSYYKGLTDFKDTYYFFRKQLVFGSIGLILFFVAANIPYHIYRKRVRLILLISLSSLVAVLFLAHTVNGAKRWIDLGFTSFQPSEFVKLAMIIYTASIMVKKQPVLNQFKRAIIPPLVVIGFICLLLVLEPHYSAIIIILSTCLVIIYCAGAKIQHLLLLLVLGIPILAAVLVMDDYRVARLTTVMDPWKDQSGEGYQLLQSLFAIGPGGLTGSGLGNSIQKLAYLPEAHTDFIFSIIGEELGFIGGATLIGLFIALIIRGVIISIQSPDQFGTLLSVGIITLISIETIFNLCVVTGLLPVTGVPLPFISYGGSALMIKMIEMGILLNISRYRMKRKKSTQTTHKIQVQG
ncbi:cell division protein FtsW [Seinonella peptonophila]|uniref:Probable peptidoglycan glycosyltransferase FtsW n=1 Tax=Seinonella peptonophila TaxID=112248 RepID=A0A1M4V5E9_9BACL|nr:putative lipid II flippase FtsW [Seinonella peptonophila]SHE64206.1 cell division protein FtsW [Seinonella peptonophila]